MDPCVSCKAEVEEAHQALSCDICNKWEHVGCVRQADRPSEALYTALVECQSKALLYVCSCCRRQGPVPQRLFQLDMERARANDERLASAQLLEQRDATIIELRAQINDLGTQHSTLQNEILELTKQVISNQREQPITGAIPKEEVATDNPSDVQETLQSGSESETSSDGSEQSRSSHRRTKAVDPHPPGFKVLISRVNKFNGDKRADDFEVWMMILWKQLKIVAGAIN